MVGELDGDAEGDADGFPEGLNEGDEDGISVGCTESDGTAEGSDDGIIDGVPDGLEVGSADNVGDSVGDFVPQRDEPDVSSSLAAHASSLTQSKVSETRLYTPGRYAHPTPQLTIPISLSCEASSPLTIRGPPLSPWHESLSFVYVQSISSEIKNFISP